MAQVHSDLENAYAVIASRFEVSPYYIEEVLTAHFDSSYTDTHGKDATPSQHNSKQEEGTYKWTMRDVRQILARIDDLRTKGVMSPLKRYIMMDAVRKDKHGKYYNASDEQLQAHLRMQQRCSIDCYGNLIQDGQIIEHHWLQSFSKSEQ